MGAEGRETDKVSKPERVNRQPRMYDGTVQGQSTARRRIGSLVESERSADAAEAPVRRVRRADPEQQSAGTEMSGRRGRGVDSEQQEAELSVRKTRRAEAAGQEQGTEAPVRRARRIETEQQTVESQQDPAGRARSVGGWRERMQERRRRKMKLTFSIFGGILLIAYIAVAVYFGGHFYEGTMIYGIDCSQLTVDEVKLEVADKLDEYVLQVVGRNDRIESIAAEQIKLEFLDNNSIDQMMKAQHSYIWPVMILLERSSMSSVAFSYDHDKAKEALEGLNCMNASIAVAPQDAYMLTTDTGFEIVPEVMGTTLDSEKALQTVLDALDQGASEVSFEAEECYVNPKIYSDNEELVRVTNAKNELAKAHITYDFGDRQEIVNAPLIETWMVELTDGSFVIDDMAVTEYVESLAAKYDTFGLTRTFYTSIGTTETLTGGDYGWCIAQDDTVVALMQALESGYQGTMEPEYLFTGMCRDTNDIGYTYVEICISQQRMWCYENGNLIVDTPVVTGNPNKDHATPSGSVWAIDAKKRDAILAGEGYSEPVDYWMPFNEDVGIHDFKERYHFGGTIYLTNGSHGCVNTPYEAVQTIYNAVSIGTPVIVYE